MANRYALQLMQLPLSAKITGRHIEDVIPNTRLHEVVRTGEAEFDHEMLIGDHDVIVNRVPIVSRKHGVTGAVSSFRSKSELYRLAEELSQVKRFAEALRAQTHEFSNKLYVISGLIQLESYQEAVDLISKESDVHQNWVQFIMTEIPDPMIGGLLIGKFNHAQELKLTFEIDRESSFRDIPAGIDRNLLVTIIGNLIDNAMEAVLAVEVQQTPHVKIFLTDLGEDLIIECEDNGVGIPDELGNAVFEKGFSTKAGEHRGIGLALVQHAVHKLNGYITFHKIRSAAHSSPSLYRNIQFPQKGVRTLMMEHQQPNIEVLIIEDDVKIAEINRRFVEKVQGFHVVGIATDDVQAKEQLDILRPNLVLLDIYMPGSNGLDMLSYIRQHFRDTDVL